MLNLLNKKLNYIEKNKWINDCKKIKLKLDKFDLTFPITKISNILKILDKNYTIVSDVGNNEYWLSKAYNYSKCRSEILYSKSFGAMGCSIGKAIGAFYGTRKPVIAFIGDQSLQMNIQELQYFTNNQIPVVLIILNNFSSGMIRSRQKLRYGEKFLHTTLETGYSLPSFKSISEAYKVKYHFINNYNIEKIKKILLKIKKPIILELKISSKIEAIPFLPKGEPIQKLKPLIKNKIFNTLEEI
jgi:acetolactate synthase-1/2/3 large subunit